jgi:hypothetical protein
MTLPPIFEHAQKLYTAFEAASAQVTDDEAAFEFGVPLGTHVYVGHWTRQFVGQPGMPGESTLQKAFGWLQAVGCLDLLRRGTRDYPGVVQLRRPPTPQDINDASPDGRDARSGKLGALQVATEGLLSRTNDLENSVIMLDEALNALTRDVELQLRKLAARIDTHDQELDDLGGKIDAL